MRIPKRFKQYGQTIEVLEKCVDPTENLGRHGFASYRLNEIHISPNIGGVPLKGDIRAHTFCHELVHFILYNAAVRIDEDKWLHKDEDAVDRIAGLLHQALTTMEYEEPTCQDK